MGNPVKIIRGQSFIGRLKHGSDLLKEITALCERVGISFGRIEAIGAVSRARLAFYDQEEKVYRYFHINEELEITSLLGNVSLKEGRVMAHIHVTLADKTGKVWGGHLAEGTIIFACEVMVTAFENTPLERNFDDETGLPLWTMQT